DLEFPLAPLVLLEQVVDRLEEQVLDRRRVAGHVFQVLQPLVVAHRRQQRDLLFFAIARHCSARLFDVRALDGGRACAAGAGGAQLPVGHFSSSNNSAVTASISRRALLSAGRSITLCPLPMSRT